MQHFLLWFLPTTHPHLYHCYHEASLTATDAPPLREERAGQHPGRGGLSDPPPRLPWPLAPGNCAGERQPQRPTCKEISIICQAQAWTGHDGRFHCLFSSDKEEEKNVLSLMPFL